MKTQKASFIKGILKGYKFQIAGIFLLKMLLMLSTLSLTYIVGLYINILTTTVEQTKILKYTGILVIITLIEIVFGYITSVQYGKTQVNMVFNINATILSHIKKVPISYFADKDAVYLNQRINEDSNTLINFILSVACNLNLTIISLCIITFILFSINWFLAIFSLLSIPIYILIYILFEKKLYKRTLQYKEAQSIFFASMNKQLNNIKFIKEKALFQLLDNELQKDYIPFFNKAFRYIKYNYLFTGATDMLSKGYNIFLFVYSAYAIYNKKMTVGEFLIVKNYYEMLIQSISQILAFLKNYPNVLVSINRLKEILNTKKEHNGDNSLSKIREIRLAEFSFSYGSKKIFDNFTYTFKEGNIYLIKGNNGVGKTTLIDNILGLYIDCYVGKIYYNDFMLKELDLYKMRREKITITEQEPTLLYDDSILKNIYINTKECDEDRVQDLMKAFNLMSISTKCKDYSGGEKQKTAILCSLIQEADVLIFDEPTSALDNETVVFFVKVLKKIKAKKIIIIVSHDNRLEEAVDDILAL